MSAKVTIKLIEDIRQDRSRGLMPAEIAARYGVPVDRVRHLTRNIKPTKRVFLEDRSEEILLLVGQGLSQREIARRLGVTSSAINKALARMEWKAAA